MINIHTLLLAAIATVCLAAAPSTKPTTAPASLAGESHQIESVIEHDLLRVRDANSKDGTPIVLYPHEDWKCMTWKFEPAGTDGSVRLVNYFTHKTFEPDADTDGSALSQHRAAKDVTDNEKWRFVQIKDDVYRLEHVATRRTLTVKSDGSVVVDKSTGDASQQWKLLAKPEHFSG